MLSKLVYTHIGKTAGTSLRITLEKAFGPGKCSPPFVQNYMMSDEARRYDAFPVICGHMLDAPADFPGLLAKVHETLHEPFWIGCQDTMPSDPGRLGVPLGPGLEMQRENVIRVRSLIDAESPPVLDRLHTLNDYDHQLWHCCQREICRRA